MNIGQKQWCMVMLVLIPLSAVSAPANFGIQQMTLDQMTNRADVICCGKMESFEFLQNTNALESSDAAIQLVARCSIDHIVKGGLSTNTILLRAGKPYRRSDFQKREDMTTLLIKANGQVQQHRMMLFLKTINFDKCVYDQIEPFGSMALLAPERPRKIVENLGQDERIEIELVEALKSLDVQHKPCIRSMLESWTRKSDAIKRALEESKQATKE